MIIEAIRDLSSELAAAPALHAQLNIEVPGYLSVKAITDRANLLIQNRGGNQMSPKRVGGIVDGLQASEGTGRIQVLAGPQTDPRVGGEICP